MLTTPENGSVSGFGLVRAVVTQVRLWGAVAMIAASGLALAAEPGAVLSDEDATVSVPTQPSSTDTRPSAPTISRDGLAEGTPAVPKVLFDAEITVAQKV